MDTWLALEPALPGSPPGASMAREHRLVWHHQAPPADPRRPPGRSRQAHRGPSGTAGFRLRGRHGPAPEASAALHAPR